MMQQVLSFSDDENEVLRKLGIVVYRGKLILEARNPITNEEVAAVEEKIGCRIPRDLLALWKTSFGGALDYDYRATFGNYIYLTGLRELYFPESKHYHDLYGWIDSELEAAQEAAMDDEDFLVYTPYLPFGGYEYLQRAYVSLLPDEYGAVIFYARGIPQKGCLNEDQADLVANSLNEFFDNLTLDQDPFETCDEFSNGLTMVERISEIKTNHPEVASKLTQLVLASVFNWRAVLAETDFSTELSEKELHALRLAFEFVVKQKDESLIAHLHQRGAPFDIALQGTRDVLALAMSMKAFDIVRCLLTLNIKVSDRPVFHAADCPDELLILLVSYGVYFDEEAFYSAAETGAIEGAIAIVESDRLVDYSTMESIIDSANQRADRHDEAAVSVEKGHLRSYLTADQYRARAKMLREFASRLQNLQ
ncbi:SMI1/KNR4 family protein [Lacunimicrobium album]